MEVSQLKPVIIEVGLIKLVLTPMYLNKRICRVSECLWSIIIMLNAIAILTPVESAYLMSIK